ncbi:hypothetical protein CRM22_010224, partial [Opisthorchis felineus]
GGPRELKSSLDAETGCSNVIFRAYRPTRSPQGNVWPESRGPRSHDKASQTKRNQSCLSGSPLPKSAATA